MLYEVLAVGGGISTIGLLIGFLWQRAVAARAQKAAGEQEQFAAQLKAALEETQKARTESDRRYEDLVAEWKKWKKEVDDALDACSQDPAAVRVRLRSLLSVPTASAGGGGKGGGSVPA